MRLQTRDIAGARPNWHPAVHERYGERLFYYLLRFAHPAQRLDTRLEELLAEAEIRAFCGYVVFGYFDALVRVWLTEPRHQRLLRVLEGHATEVTETRHFQADQIRYLWSRNDENLAGRRDPAIDHTVTALTSDIEAVTGKTEFDSESGPGEQLIKRGLLLKPPRSAQDVIKFYVVLQRTATAEFDQASEIRQLVHCLKSEPRLADKSSLYSGTGTFAAHLVRAISPSYKEVLDISRSLADAVENLPLRPMTLLIANVDALETDDLNDVMPFGVEDQRAAELIGGELESQFQGLTAAQRASLHQLLREVTPSLVETTFWPDFRELLQGCLSNNGKRVREKLSFLFDMELLLGEYLKRVWAELVGPRWIGRLRALAEKAEIDKYLDNPSDPRTWTLRNYVDLAKLSADDNAQVRALLGKDLDSDWHIWMRRVGDLRNDLAHGRLVQFRHFDDFDGTWGDLLRDVARVGHLYARLGGEEMQ